MLYQIIVKYMYKSYEIIIKPMLMGKEWKEFKAENFIHNFFEEATNTVKSEYNNI